MSSIDPKLLEYFARLGQKPEVVKETPWSYTYKLGEKSYGRVSKFLLDENFIIPASDMRLRWAKMNEDERKDFAAHFWVKEHWSANDTELLEIVMQDGNDYIWRNCATAFLKHPDRDRVVSFLIQRLGEVSDDQPLNYIQALGSAKDKKATPAIKPYFDRYQKAVGREKDTGVPDDVFFGPIPYHAYFVAAGALLQIEGTPEYEQAIRSFLDHSHKQVRWWADYALRGGAPRSD
jgi:hypothetical protein